MTVSSSWDKFHKFLYAEPSLDFYLDLYHTGITENTLHKYESLFHKAFQDMSALEAGAIANPDENRRVGHYWLRNSELAPDEGIREQIDTTNTQIADFSKQILNGHLTAPNGKAFTDLMVIGIGGSALGPQFIGHALGEPNGLQAHYLDNTDPDGMDQTFESIGDRLAQTLVLVISKSGGTAETRNGMLEAQQCFDNRGLDFPRQAVAITGEGSQLYQTARNEKWLSIFPMWDWVGGRTSVMSAVGLLPAALMGIDVEAFLSGAKRMDELTRSETLLQNPAALLALSWYILGDGRGSKDMVILPYKDKLLLFSRYLQQLIMESLGKSHDLDGKQVDQGIAVYGNKGSTDQHAYVQQLRDGLDNFFVTFIEVLKDRKGASIQVDGQNSSGDYLFGFLMGTETALSEKDRRSLVISIGDLSARSIAALIALYERAVGFYASFVNINAYHQPGVEAGKKAASSILELKNRILKLLNTAASPRSIDQIAQELELEGSERQIYLILRSLHANQPLDIEGTFHMPEKLRVSLKKR